MNRKSAAVMNWRNRTKQKLVQYKGGKCQKCGYESDVPSVYDFHHRDATKKDFSISGKSWSFERLKEEVDKCDLLCRNCHAELHWLLQSEQRLSRQELLVDIVLSDVNCKVCEKLFRPTNSAQVYCSLRCAHVPQQKCSHPTEEELKEMLLRQSFCEIGRRYGVSDNAVRKWAKKYGLIF